MISEGYDKMLVFMNSAVLDSLYDDAWITRQDNVDDILRNEIWKYFIFIAEYYVFNQ